MADDCDMSDKNVQAGVERSVEASRRALGRKLAPIVQVIGSERVGYCHNCGTEILPGYLFCPQDDDDPGSTCAAEWERDQERRRGLGL